MSKFDHGNGNAPKTKEALHVNVEIHKNGFHNIKNILKIIRIIRVVFNG